MILLVPAHDISRILAGKLEEFFATFTFKVALIYRVAAKAALPTQEVCRDLELF
jgi:hypothetical protein